MTEGIEISIGSMRGVFFHKRIVNESQKGVVIASEDFLGAFTYSVFELRISEISSEYLSKDDKTIINQDKIIEIALEMVRKLVTSYRLVTKKDWIPDLTRAAICPITLISYDADGSVVSGPCTIDYRGTGVMIGTVLDEDEDNKICELCISNFQIDTAYQYLSKANRFKHHKNYEEFCLYLCFYMESWLFREIKNKQLSVGKTDLEIEELFKNKKGTYLFPDDLIKRVLGEDVFKAVEGSDARRRFDQVVAYRRNGIAHGRGIVISEVEAEDMILAMLAYRDLLQNIIWPTSTPVKSYPSRPDLPPQLIRSDL